MITDRHDRYFPALQCFALGEGYVSGTQRLTQLTATLASSGSQNIDSPLKSPTSVGAAELDVATDSSRDSISISGTDDGEDNSDGKLWV